MNDPKSKFSLQLSPGVRIHKSLQGGFMVGFENQPSVKKRHPSMVFFLRYSHRYSKAGLQSFPPPPRTNLGVMPPVIIGLLHHSVALHDMNFGTSFPDPMNFCKQG